MNCPSCKTINESGSIFCVACGANMTGTGSAIRVNVDPTHTPPGPGYDSSHSVETSVFSPNPGPSGPSLTYTPSHLNNVQARQGGGKSLWIVVGVLIVLILAGGGYFLFNMQKASAETLPDHLGMFTQSADKQKVDEIKKQDLTNALDGKDNLLKDETLPVLDPNPNFILYLDEQDVPTKDLRLIQLDTLKNDGALKQLPFQTAPVEGKSGMRRLRIPDGVANGKYAFALIDGYINEGKHKFWPFQVKNSSKSDNNDALQATTVALKPKTPQVAQTNPGAAINVPKPVVPPPSGGAPATCISNNVRLRNGPSQTNTSVIGKLGNGQRVYVIEYSANYETFQGKYANFAHVQTDSGQTGWVFAAYIR